MSASHPAFLTPAQWAAYRCGRCVTTSSGWCIRCQEISSEVIERISLALPSPRHRYTAAKAAALFPTIAFSPTPHEYFRVYADGRREQLEGVTDTLHACRMVNLFNIPHETLIHARDRGTRVHKAMHYVNQNDLDWSSLTDPDDIARVQAGIAFLADTRFRPVALERRVFHKRHGYVGTCDAVGFWDRGFAVADYKCSRDPDRLAADLQLAAYAEALRDDPPPEWLNPPWLDVAPFTPSSPIRRIGVCLLPEGWKPKLYTNPTDALTFFACLRIFREQIARGTYDRKKDNDR
jgi:hypothetical protein